MFDASNRICVNCGSKNTALSDPSRKTYFGRILYNRLPQLFDKEQWHCFHCGQNF